ncbi:uncharacterized protein G2W53_003752 [Senna tora]|uniref:Uncharacterized protein n=1 Tax=Senna tora TaxID=362788 RepID=A0A835CGN8_9FABA|nr:uncharacterized protein G2W53_003752 [Senna tora]
MTAQGVATHQPGDKANDVEREYRVL